MSPTPRTVHVGRWRCDVVSDGVLWLDGGSMFGVVPRPTWSALMPTDDDNRVCLGLNSVLARDGRHTVLIEAGMGDKWSADELAFYGRPPGAPLIANLASLGVAPADITHVIFSHLHLDHAGNATRRDADGRAVPTFPNARHIAQRGEWDAAHNTDALTRHSYTLDDLDPLMRAGLVDLIDGNVEILPGIRARVTGGHTRDHMIVTVEDGGEALYFLADIIPTAHHFRPAWHMGWDLFPQQVAKARQALVEELAERRPWVVLGHDATTPLGRVRREGKRVVVEPPGG